MIIAHCTIAARLRAAGPVVVLAVLAGGPVVAQTYGAPFAGGEPNPATGPAVPSPAVPPAAVVSGPAPVFVSTPVIQSLTDARSVPSTTPLTTDIEPVLRRDDPVPALGSDSRVERGLRLDPVYLDAAHTVSDTRAWGLPTPPSGQRWVRAYEDAALVGADGVVREVRRGMNWDRRAADAATAVERTTAQRTALPGDRYYDSRCFSQGDPRDRAPLGACPPRGAVEATGNPVAVLRPRTIPGGTTVTTITTPAPTVTTVVVEEYGPADER